MLDKIGCKVFAECDGRKEFPALDADPGLRVSALAGGVVADRSARKRKIRAVVADPYPEVTKLLNKCSPRWSMEFRMNVRILPKPINLNQLMEM